MWNSDLPEAGAAEMAAWGEVRPPDEARATQTILASIEEKVRAAAAADPPARRDAHPKAHGCVRAEFRVLDDLPPALRVGLFARPRSFAAWIRFSNGSAKPGPDRVGDGRGMAVKVMGVEDSPSTTQDLVMINAPAFFVRNAADYVAFEAAANPLAFFFPGLDPFRWRLHELLAARAIAGRKVFNVLNSRYWSMTPYGLGEAACKYSASPAGASPFQSTEVPDFLRENLVRHLAEREAVFDFLVQPRMAPTRMPIEDPTIVWPETAGPFIPVAKVTIPAQIFDTPERRALGEALSFTPWHGLAAHRPLGGINRVKRKVYEHVSRLRHQMNGEARQEPTGTSG
jgi:hypothetical protein